VLNLREPMKEMGERGDIKKEQVLRLSEIAKRPVNARGGTGGRVAGLRTGAFVFMLYEGTDERQCLGCYILYILIVRHRPG
jgi:hypothetical protein